MIEPKLQTAISGREAKSLRQRVDKLKQDLADVFDENLSTTKWKNVADYFIIGMILLSSVEIFLSTFDVGERFRRLLYAIELLTLAFFTIEVSLRIWVAPLKHPKYSGWRGRIRYCLTFNGFIDFISTYPFYLQWLIPFPIGWMKAFRMSRTVRLFRLSRYMKSWNLLTHAVKDKKRELLISLQFLLIVTFILSLVLYFFEHEEQPEVYVNGFSSVMWAFAQYIGDPGHFGDTPPLTGAGKGIACIVGLLGIAIVAVPAGIIGTGFTEAIENDKLSERRKALRGVFERKFDSQSGYMAVNFFRSIVDIQTHTGMTQPQIVETVRVTPGFRLVNLASTFPISENQPDKLAIEHFVVNRPYGLMIDRGSAVTIVSPASVIDPAIGIFSYYLALIGGFNFISRETGETSPYQPFEEIEYDMAEHQEEYIRDLRFLTDREGGWSVTMLACGAGNEESYPEEIHFITGPADGPEAPGGKAGIYVKDKKLFADLYRSIEDAMKRFDITTECDARYEASPGTWLNHIRFAHHVNSIMMKISWEAFLRNVNRLEIATEMAAALNRTLLGRDNPQVAALERDGIGFDGYDDRRMDEESGRYEEMASPIANTAEQKRYSAMVIMDREEARRQRKTFEKLIRRMMDKTEQPPCVLHTPGWHTEAWMEDVFERKVAQAVGDSVLGIGLAVGETVRQEVIGRMRYEEITGHPATREWLAKGGLSSRLMNRIRVYESSIDGTIMVWTGEMRYLRGLNLGSVGRQIARLRGAVLSKLKSRS